MELDELPPNDRAPIVVAAFQGWNDAGQAATTAVRYLVASWRARAFARIDPEEYFSFTDTRPMIRIAEGSSRELVWPRNEFYYSEGSLNTPPAVLLIGTEPNLRWRSFCGEIIALAEKLGATYMVTLGSLVTDAVHTRPVPLTGFSTDPGVAQRLLSLNVNRANYEGPTGIVGTLHNLSTKAGLSTMSVWAATPYYLGATPNPKTALGLLEAIDQALALGLDLNELRDVAEEFARQVSLAVRDNAEVQERIRLLEAAYDERGATAIPPQQQQQPPDFPETGAIIADLESFLREQRSEE
jgi:proteasome assembly chaperone (PAC2) family protein